MKPTRQLKIVLGISILATALVVCRGFAFRQQPAKQAMVRSSFALVELFTSEGCSSCPAADALISKIDKERNPNVFVLSYHVDYWDRLGWKDPFSKAAWSARQRQYANQLSLEGVYTPQVVVNGSEEFVGSNEMRLRNSITKALQQADGSLMIKAAERKGNTIHVSYEALIAKPSLLNMALVQPSATTNVRRGENGGKQLHHINIVRTLTSIEAVNGEGKIDIAIPLELKNTPLKIIAFVQQKHNMAVVAATMADIN
jgi:hypothetical protein